MAIAHDPNRLLRSCFTSTGKPKKKHASKAAAKGYNKQRRTSLQAYQCSMCGQWHLGVKRRRGRR